MRAVFVCADLRRDRLAFLAFRFIAAFFFLILACNLGGRFSRPIDLLVRAAFRRLFFNADAERFFLRFRICMFQQRGRLPEV